MKRLRVSGGRRQEHRRHGRTAAVLAALGLFLASSGVSLVVASSASAAPEPKVDVCHATTSDTNPYVEITVSANALGHLDTQRTPGSPKHFWKTAGYWAGIFHNAGDPKYDLVDSYTDSAGVFHPEDGAFLAAHPGACSMAAVGAATAAVNWIEPTCTTSAGWVGVTEPNVTYALTSGTLAPGATVTVTATAAAGFGLPPAGASTEAFTHTFTTPTGCGVAPPGVATATAPGVVQATCTNLTGAAWVPGVATHATYSASGPAVPGTTITITATADPGFTFAGGATTETFTITFATPSGCSRNLTLTNPSVTFHEPTCTTPAGWTQGGAPGASYALTAGTVAPGHTITVTATALSGYKFTAGGATTQAFTHTFKTLPKCYGKVVRATVNPTFVNPSCSGNVAGVNLAGQGILNESDLKARGGQEDIDGITYTVSGTLAAGATVTVTAVADPHITLMAGSATSWSHTFTAVQDCTANIPSAIDSGMFTTAMVPSNNDAVMRDWGYGLALTGGMFVAGAFLFGRRRETA